jgi:hypothetical protein
MLPRKSDSGDPDQFLLVNIKPLLTLSGVLNLFRDETGEEPDGFFGLTDFEKLWRVLLILIVLTTHVAPAAGVCPLFDIPSEGNIALSQCVLKPRNFQSMNISNKFPAIT